MCWNRQKKEPSKECNHDLLNNTFPIIIWNHVESEDK